MKYLKNIFRVIFFKALNYKVFYIPTSRIFYLFFIFKNRNIKKIYNILLLSPYRFRDDLDSLSNLEDINIVKFPLKLQYFLFSSYSDQILLTVFFIKKTMKNFDYLIKLNILFENLLSYSLKKLGINIVASSALNYSQDAIYFQFFKNKKIKIIIIARENLAFKNIN